jgi:hypothetical protein
VLVKTLLEAWHADARSPRIAHCGVWPVCRQSKTRTAIAVGHAGSNQQTGLLREGAGNQICGAAGRSDRLGFACGFVLGQSLAKQLPFAFVALVDFLWNGLDRHSLMLRIELPDVITIQIGKSSAVQINNCDGLLQN